LESRRFVPAICLLLLLSGVVDAAQNWPNDWKPGEAHDVDGFLVYSLADAWHISAYEQLINVYRWNGAEYKKADCYNVSRDRDNPISGR